MVWGAGWRKWKGPWVLVGIQMALSLAVEILAMRACRMAIPNAIFYTAYLPIEFILLLLIARHYLPLRHNALYIAFATATYVGAMVFELRSYGTCDELAVRTVVSGALLLTALYGFLLFRLSEEVDRPLWQVPEFWLFLSFILYFGIMTPAAGLSNYLQKNYPDVNDRTYTIIEILFVVRYTLAACALVLKLREYRT